MMILSDPARKCCQCPLHHGLMYCQIFWLIDVIISFGHIEC